MTEHGPSESVCRHFGRCGGCVYQDLPDEDYRALKRQAVVDALTRHGLADAEVSPLFEVGPHTRRRAVFKIAKPAQGSLALGFHAASSHDIVDMEECRVLTPTLFSRLTGLRAMMEALLRANEKADLFVTETETGPDVAVSGLRLSAARRAPAAAWAERLKLARLTIADDIAAELAQPVVKIGPASVTLPPRAFLQATKAGETELQARVGTAVGRARAIVDLFSGCGTFALPLAAISRVHAVEEDRAALAALANAVSHTQGLKPVTVERRDLFKHPLGAAELNRFDAAVLDPPRAGALRQAEELTRSKIRRVAYVSCNPESFARDARILVSGGYRLGAVTAVDQFLWSSHIELVAGLTRE